MTENIQIQWTPNAQALDFLIQPLLNRSYQMFVENARKDVTSEYMGGNILIVTTQTPDGKCVQLAFTREEIPLLSPEARSLLEADLKRPAKRGVLTVKGTT